jgi:hypothetical protein
MTEETSEWLAPMLEAAERRPDTSIPALMGQATMPAAEADSVSVRSPTAPPEEARALAVDWIRFGQLLRDELGLVDYPEEPPAS